MSVSNAGFNISGYPTALVNKINKKNKLQYDHYLMSYAVTNSGLSNFNKNYKVPVHALREDFKSYIGFENAKGQWRQLTRLWVGDWYKENEIQNNNETVKSGDKVNSYLYNWSLKEIGHDDYILNKFGDEKYEGHADVLPTERVFIVKNAPIPCEYNYATLFVKRDEKGNPIKDAENNFIYIEVNKDPYPNLTKIVDKNYIDNRFNGVRIINADNTVGAVIKDEDYKYADKATRYNDTLIVQNENNDSSVQDYPIDFGDADTAFLRFRPYTCVYEFTKHIKCVHLYDDLDCGNGKTTRDSLIPEARDGKDSQPESNLLTFFIKLPKPDGNDSAEIDKQGIVFLANDNVLERNVTEKYQQQISEKQITKSEKYTPSIRWSFHGERHRVIKQAWIANREVLIKCEAHYTTDEQSGKKILNVLCSSALNYDQGISAPEYIAGYACNDFRHNYSNCFPSCSLLFHHTFVNPTNPDGSVNDDSILDELWDVNDTTKGTYADNVNKVHVSSTDRQKWESHVDDVDKDKNTKPQLHFAEKEKQSWLNNIYNRYERIQLTTDYITIDTQGGSIELDDGSFKLESKVAHIGLKTINEMSNTKPTDVSIPTTEALYAHAFDWSKDNKPNEVKSQPLHVTAEEKYKWNSLSNLTAGDCINIFPDKDENGNDVKKISVATVEDIELTSDDKLDSTVPTTNAVKKYAKGAGGIQYEDKKGDEEAPKSSNFRFFGPWVHQIVEIDENGEKLVKLYFGENNNPKPIQAIEIPTSKTSMYLYKSDSSNDRYDDYSLPDNFVFTKTNGSETDTKYNYVFQTGENINKIRIKGEDDNFVIPVDLPTDESNEAETENCIIVELIHKTPTGDKTTSSTANFYLPIKIDSNTKKYVIKQTPDMGTYEETINKDGKVSYEISYMIQEGLQITFEELIINQKEDAEEGFLPGFVRAKGYISINSSSSKNRNNTALSEVGPYELLVTTKKGSFITGPTTSKKQIFVYKAMTDNAQYNYINDENQSDGQMTAEVKFVGSTTKWVSGIEYHAAAKMDVNVDNIRYTQPYVTKNTNRIKLNWTNSSDSNISTTRGGKVVSTDEIISKGNDLTAKTDDKGLSVSSVFTYNTENKNEDGIYKIESKYDVGKFSIQLDNVSIFKQDGETLSKNISSGIVQSTKYIWTHESGTPNDYTITFNADNDTNGETTYYRYLNAFDPDPEDPNTNGFLLQNDIENPTGSDYEYNSDTSLLEKGKYEKELLVQGGWLKHPNNDLTKKYTNVKGVRCYVRRIKLDSSSVDDLGKLRMTVEEMKKDYYITTKDGTSDVNFYLACPGNDYILHLNATYNGNTENVEKIVRVAKSTELTGSESTSYSWIFQTYSNTTWPIFGKNKQAYYLIVTMNENAEKIGSIKIEVIGN